MGGRSRSPAPRVRLTYDGRVRAFVMTILLAGCSHSAVVVSNANPVVQSSPVSASGAVAAAILAGTAAIAASQEPASPQAVPSSTMFTGQPSRLVPAMLPEREVGLQDCTKPIDLTAGNLRCR